MALSTMINRAIFLTFNNLQKKMSMKEERKQVLTSTTTATRKCLLEISVEFLDLGEHEINPKVNNTIRDWILISETAGMWLRGEEGEREGRRKI